MLITRLGRALDKRALVFLFVPISILIVGSGCDRFRSPTPVDTLEPSPTTAPSLIDTLAPLPIETDMTAAEMDMTAPTRTLTSPDKIPNVPIGIGVYDSDDVAFFNRFAREQDVIAVRPQVIDLLDEVEVGLRMLVVGPNDEEETNFRSVISEAKEKGVTLLGYNLETALPVEELISKEMEMQRIAAEEGLLYVFGPTLGKLLKHYDDFSQPADIIVIQSQRFQMTEEYEKTIEELIAKTRSANSETEVWVQVSVNPPEKQDVTADEVVTDIQTIADKADLIWIFFSPQRASVMEEVVVKLRQPGDLVQGQPRGAPVPTLVEPEIAPEKIVSLKAPLFGYWVFSRPSDLPLDELNDYTNVIFLGHDYKNDLPSEKDLQALRESDLKLVLKLDRRIVEEDFDQHELEKLRNKLEPYQDVVLAIFPVDEPYKPQRWKSYSDDELKTLIQQVKGVFADYKIFENFYHPAKVSAQLGYYPEVPENIDFISIDIYMHNVNLTEDKYKAEIGSSLTLIKEKAGTRPVFFASRGFSLTSEHSTVLTGERLEWDYELFREYGLIGLGWYFYDELSPNGKAYGSSHYPEIIAIQKEIGQRILRDAKVENTMTVPNVEVASSTIDPEVIQHPLIVAIEQRTLEKYPDIENQIGLAIENVNQRLAASGMNREFYIDQFTPAYDKGQITSCKARESGGGFLPDEYCNHTGNLVYLAVDESESKNYPDRQYPSVEWHGVKENNRPPHKLFTPDGISVLAHELGHVLGLPDLYLLRIAAQDNHVNGQEFPSEAYNPFEGDIMYYMPTGIFSGWDREILDRENIILPARYETWFDYQPEYTVLRFIDQDGQPMPQVGINVYQSSRTPNHKQEIDDIPEYHGQTDHEGRFLLGPDVLGLDRHDAIKIFLVEIDFNGQVDYLWFNFMDVNFAFWNSEEVLLESNIDY